MKSFTGGIGSGNCVALMIGPSEPMSLPVKTATTPGSSERGLGVDAENVGGRVRAAHNACEVHAGQLDVVDVRCRAGDQPRIFLAPDPLTDQAWQAERLWLPSLAPPRSLGGCAHGIHDVLIAGAAAQITFEPVPDLFFRRRRITVEQMSGRHDHAGRTIAALEPVLIPEACCTGCSLPSTARPSIVTMLRPSH